jgi:hypothetical protein
MNVKKITKKNFREWLAGQSDKKIVDVGSPNDCVFARYYKTIFDNFSVIDTNGYSVRIKDSSQRFNNPKWVNEAQNNLFKKLRYKTSSVMTFKRIKEILNYI